MGVRPFDWRDLPVLIRYRNHGLFLDSATLLTRGAILVSAGALFSYLAPATGIFTYLCSNKRGSGPLLGQVIHNSGSSCARLSYLSPERALESEALPVLLEHVISHLGERGAIHLLAEVDERTVAFEALRRSSFAIYVRQRIWQFKGQLGGDGLPSAWRMATERDIIPVRSLYNGLVPGLVQQVEPLSTDYLRGMVFCEGGDLLAYVEVRQGPRGIWVQPFVHPDAEEINDLLVDLLRNLTERKSRPVYLCVRSYQSWLEPYLEDLGAEAGPAQAVMVKHLAIAKRVARSFALRTLEGGQHEATAPFVRSESKK